MTDEKTREKLYSLMGDLPDRNAEITTRLVREEDCGSYVLETLTLDLNGTEPVPTYFTRPKNAVAPYPVVLFSHWHGGMYFLGKNQLITPHEKGNNCSYAEAMAKKGIACLCIDHWCFGERSGRDESETYKTMLWDGKVMWGMMVFDSLRAVDYLVSRTDVDSSRIGALGMSMGSTMSMWVAALDTRIKTCVDICCLTDFDEIERSNGINEHGIYYYVPSLRKNFSMADINALIAPRSHLSTVGIYDGLTPIRGVDKIKKLVSEFYKKNGAEGGFTLKKYPCGHAETIEMRTDILAFIDKTL